MSTRAAPDGRAGWIEFAAVVMFAVAFFRIIEAIAYFSKSHKLNDLSGGFFSSHVWAWGACLSPICCSSACLTDSVPTAASTGCELPTRCHAHGDRSP